MASLMQRLEQCLNFLRKALIPVSSLLTVGVVSYVSYAYFIVYVPALHEKGLIEGSSIDWSKVFEDSSLFKQIYK